MIHLKTPTSFPFTEEQDELVDQIEHQVKTAIDYIETGCGDNGLDEVMKHHMRTIGKKQCCIVINCVVIIGVILTIVIGTQSAKGKLAVASIKGKDVGVFKWIMQYLLI